MMKLEIDELNSVTGGMGCNPDEGIKNRKGIPVGECCGKTVYANGENTVRCPICQKIIMRVNG